jgi:hypothetical protein
MLPTGMMVNFLNTQITHTSGAHQWFLTYVVLPNIGFFANIVRVGEVLTGCLLLLGFYTRIGGLIGCMLTLNYISAKGGLAHLSVWSGLDSLAFVLSLTCLVLPAGRVLGVDALLAHLRGAPPPRVRAQPVFVDEPPMTGPSAPKS